MARRRLCLSGKRRMVGELVKKPSQLSKLPPQVKSTIRFWMPAGLLQKRGRRRLDKYAFDSTSMEIPIRSIEDLFPGIESIHIDIAIPELYRPPDMVMPIVELLTISAICQLIKPKKIFEIGTFTGSTALAMAKSSPPETEIYTLDLPPDANLKHADPVLVGSAFRGTIESSKICQLYGDSAKFDYTLYEEQMDLVLVDANHSYNSVKLDSETAIRLIRAGGIVIWDDYALDIRHPECAGVTRAVNEIALTKPCFQIRNTRLAIHASDLSFSAK